MNPLLSNLSSISNIPPALLMVVLAWSLVWKGLALWKAAKRNSKPWFVALLVINTIGIFEILYIFVFSEIKLTEDKKTKKPKAKVKKVKPISNKGFLE